MARNFVLLLLLVLAPGCMTRTVVEYRDVLVRVPVAVPCLTAANRPTPVAPLNVRIAREVWDAMSTDQRAAAISANGVRRVVYEHETEVVLVACDTAE